MKGANKIMYLATLRRFLRLIFPELSSSNNLNAFKISSCGSRSNIMSVTKQRERNLNIVGSRAVVKPELKPLVERIHYATFQSNPFAKKCMYALYIKSERFPQLVIILFWQVTTTYLNAEFKKMPKVQS